MTFYYQYDKDGLLTIQISAIVKSSGTPLNVDQIVTDTALPAGIKKFDPVAKEVIFFKDVYDENDERIDIIEDTSIPREKIDDANILQKV